MREIIALITGGPLDNYASALLKDVDRIVCADGGVDFALRNNLTISEVFGDFDSISRAGKAFIESADIPVHTFPIEKDMTDTELALRTLPIDSDIILVCPLKGRIDHVMTNLNLILKLREEGYEITATDGVTDIIPLSGEDYVSIPEMLESDCLAVSLIPMSETVTGVRSNGLYYELDNYDLSFGSSFSNSNKLKKDSKGFEISIEDGKMLVVITEAE